MTPRLTRFWRNQRTLLLHELREQGPLGLVLLAAGVVITFGVRILCRAEPGEVSAQLPFFVPALAALLLAFPAADLFGRDVGSGLVRTLAAAPIGRLQLMAPRLAVFVLVAALVGALLGAMEPAAELGSDPSRSALAYAAAPLIVSVALAGAWLHSAATALAIGVLVYGAVGAGLGVASSASMSRPDLAAVTRVFAEQFTAAMSLSTLVPSALAALVLVAALRGARTRRPAVRFVHVCGAALLFVAPPTISAALATQATVDVRFDDPDAIVRVSTDPESTGTGGLVLHLTAQPGPWTSSWSVDPSTGTTRRRPALPWEQKPLLDTSCLAEPMRAARGGVEARFALANGTTTDWLWMGRYSWPGLTSPRDRIVYISEESTLEVVSLIDGTRVSLRDVPELDFVLAPRLSPDGRWVALCDWVRFDPKDRGRGYHRARLVDTASGAVVQSVDYTGVLGWQTGPSPLVVVDAPNGRFRREGPRYLALGPEGAAPWPVDDGVLGLEPLTEGRFVCTTHDMRVLVMRADGTVERTLRAPREESAR